MKTGKLKDGTSVSLETPEPCDKDPSRYKVHVDTDSGVVTVRFSGNPAKSSSTSKLNPAYWNEKIAGVEDRSSNHSAFLDSANRKIRSVRDGTQEYLGIQIGELPANKIFKIYRSADEISKLATKMNGVPLIADHIDPDLTPQPESILTVITETEVVECIDDSTNSTVCLEHTIPETLKVIDTKESGLNEFSLGYKSKWRASKGGEPWDFEQYDFKPPPHLAMVSEARGGKSLSFIDSKGKKMDKLEKFKKFVDGSGELTMEELSDVVSNFPEKIKSMDISELKKLIAPFLARSDLKVEDEENTKKEGSEEEEKKTIDEDVKIEDMNKDEREKFTDSVLFKSIVSAAKKDKSFLDSNEFASAVKKEAESRFSVIEKAKSFLDEQFDFPSKSTNEIMESVIATQTDQKFLDSQLETAFSMIKANDKYKSFGDSSAKEHEEIKKKEY